VTERRTDDQTDTTDRIIPSPLTPSATKLITAGPSGRLKRFLHASVSRPVESTAYDLAIDSSHVRRCLVERKRGVIRFRQNLYRFR